MANRWLNQFVASFNKAMVNVYGQVAIGATGACTLSAANSKGIVSVTRNDTGLYTFVFGTNSTSLDKYYHFCGLTVSWVNSGSAPDAPIVYVVADNSAAAAASIQIQCLSVAGSAADPGTGELMLVGFDFQNSSAF